MTPFAAALVIAVKDLIVYMLFALVVVQAWLGIPFRRVDLLVMTVVLVDGWWVMLSGWWTGWQISRRGRP